MPIRRRKTRTNRRRRVRRYRKSRIPRNIPNTGSVLIKRSTQLSDLTGSAATPTHETYEFMLTDLPGYTEFTNLFDFYKLEKVHLTFLQVGRDINTTSSSYSNGYIMICHDYNDGTDFTTTGEYLETAGVKQMISTVDKFTDTIRPRAAKMVYQSAVSTGYGPYRGWVSSGNPAVPHYSVKVYLTQFAAAADVAKFHVFADYYIRLKGIH